MQIIGGPIRFSDLTRAQIDTRNTGVIAVASGDTEILDTILFGNPDCETGDRMLVSFRVMMTKGGVAGESRVRLEAGDQAAQWEFTLSLLHRADYNIPSQPAGSNWIVSGCGVFLVASAGTNRKVRLIGNSAGSDSSVAIGDAELAFQILRR